MKADDGSREFSEVFSGWNPEKSPFSECCLAVLELQRTLRAWSFPRVSAWMRWVHSEFRGFALYSTSQFCLGYTQGRDTRAWPTRKVGLDKKGHKFTKNQKSRRNLPPLSICPGKWQCTSQTQLPLMLVADLWHIWISSLATAWAAR